MISIFHLLWIVPLAGSVGFMTAAMLAVSNKQQKPCLSVGLYVEEVKL